MPRPLKKISFVANTSWSIYNFRLEVALYLKNAGFQIYVIAPRDKHSEKLIASGFTFIEAPIKAYSSNPFDDFKYLSFLYKTYRRHKFDHIFHYTIKANIYGSIAAHLSACKSTSIVTGLGRLLNMPLGFKRTFVIMLYKLGVSFVDHIWFLNEFDKTFFVQNKIAHHHTMTIIPGEGVDLVKFNSKKEKDSSLVSFLFAGRLLKEKGIHLFLESALVIKKYYPDVSFDVVGFIEPKDSDSIDQEELLGYQSKYAIKYHGDTEDIRPFIEHSSCVVLPSFYGEGVSRILLESASMNTPIITTDNRGCSGVVIDGYNGFICRQNDLQHLIDQMMAFISLDNEAKETMGKNGRNLVEQHFDIKAVFYHYEQRLGILEHEQALKTEKV